MIESRNEIVREGAHVHFEAYGQSGFGADARTDAAKLGSLDGLMKHERAAPERFIPKRVEAKGLAALGD